MVVTDPLTGLPNRRRLLEVLGMEIARADRNDRPFAVVFFDMVCRLLRPTSLRYQLLCAVVAHNETAHEER